MISAKQIALLHVARRQLGLDDGIYRAILSEHGHGAATAKDLDTPGFERVVSALNRMGFRSTSSKRTYGHRPGMATPSQIELIRALWREWSGSDDETALNKWLEKFFHVSAMRFLTPETAHKAINALRRMAKREPRAPGGSCCP